MIKLVAQNLECSRGTRLVFRHINFSLHNSQSLILTGANGCGKTSLLRIIAGIAKPHRGSLEFFIDKKLQPPAQQCHFIAHKEAIKQALTVRENIEFWAQFLGGKTVDSGKINATLDIWGLLPFANYSANLLSQGQKRRLALCRLLLVKRPLWLLDEPLSALDKSSRDVLFEQMHKHLDGGGMIVASSHDELGLKGSIPLHFQSQLKKS